MPTQGIRNGAGLAQKENLLYLFRKGRQQDLCRVGKIEVIPHFPQHKPVTRTLHVVHQGSVTADGIFYIHPGIWLDRYTYWMFEDIFSFLSAFTISIQNTNGCTTKYNAKFKS